MPLRFWNDAFTSAIFLVDKLPTKVFTSTSLYVKLFHVNPNYCCLRTFGCLSYPHLRPITLINCNLDLFLVCFLATLPLINVTSVLILAVEFISLGHIRFDETVFPYTILFTQPPPISVIKHVKSVSLRKLV